MSSPLVPPSPQRLRLHADTEAFVPLSIATNTRALLAQTAQLDQDAIDGGYTALFARSNKGSIEWERNKGDIRKLIKYWTTGPGRAKIGWGKPCDFCSCVNKLRKYIPQDHKLKGFCARLHKRATGKWPGPRSKGKHCPC